MYLKDLRSPAELHQMSEAELQTLAGEMRAEIIRTVSRNGGHLASNLGAVELTLALYRTFDLERDQVVWDVGHQCYPHKLLTGRFERFGTLRQTDGVCGFFRRNESKYDLFNTGHASTALSSALGLARARDRKNENYSVVAVVGDGALTGGMCYEALNDIGSSREPVIIILNDNGMSISGNVGALSNYLTYLRLSRGWQRVKKTVGAGLKKLPVGGNALYGVFQRLKDHVRNVFVRDTLFSSLGIRYMGPIDGHDLPGMEWVFRKAAELNEPVVIHVMTRKGEGFRPAEEKPEQFHGTPPFDPETGEPREDACRTFGKAAARHLCALAEQDDAVCVVTAAMAAGTGMDAFAERFPERFTDVGIAEEHAVTMAAGMARGGMKPVVAIYDTFLQRSYDQLMEDVCAQELPVVLLVDRAGLSGADGASHHGIYGTSYLSTLPGMTVLYPRCVAQMRQMLDWALEQPGSVAICYPRAEDRSQPPCTSAGFDPYVSERLRAGDDCAIWAVGSMTTVAMETAQLLAERGLSAEVRQIAVVHPLPDGLPSTEEKPYFTLEENQFSGSFGAQLAAWAVQSGRTPPRHVFTLPDAFIPHGSRTALLQRCGLDGKTLADEMERRLRA